MRKFERSCLRLCSGIKRSPESGYMKYVSNKILYNNLNINRIDNHIISLIRKHWQRASNNFNNSSIFGPVLSLNDSYIEQCLLNGNIPPEAFVYLDKNGYIQDPNGVPLLYHITKELPRKTIKYDPRLDTATANPLLFTYDMSIPQVDIPNKNAGLWSSCWWLEGVT